MKVVKIMFGILASLFVLAHLIGIPSMPMSGDLAFSKWMGKLVGILLGSAIAVACFRSAAKS